MAIPEHDKCVKLMKRCRKHRKDYKKKISIIPNRYKKRIKRKRTISFARYKIMTSKSKFKAIRFGYKRLLDYYKALFGPYYRKWNKYVI